MMQTFLQPADASEYKAISYKEKERSSKDALKALEKEMRTPRTWTSPNWPQSAAVERPDQTIYLSNFSFLIR